MIKGIILSLRRFGGQFSRSSPRPQGSAPKGVGACDVAMPKAGEAATHSWSTIAPLSLAHKVEHCSSSISDLLFWSMVATPAQIMDQLCEPHQTVPTGRRTARGQAAT
jgi:hypothetical protein